MEEKELKQDFNSRKRLTELISIGAASIGLDILTDKIGLKFYDLFNKLSLITSNSPDSAEPILKGTMITGLIAGVYSGITDRYHASSIMFGFSFLPEFFDLYNEGNVLLNGKRILAKTALIYSAFAVSKLGKGLHNHIKKLSDPSQITPGEDLF